MAYIPVVQDVEKWVKHFKDMAEGKLRPSNFYVVGKSEQTGNGSTNGGPSITLVSPTAAAVERAKSILKSQEKEDVAVLEAINRLKKRPQKRRGKKNTKKKKCENLIKRINRYSTKKVRKNSTKKVKRNNKKNPPKNKTKKVKKIDIF